MFMNTFFSNMLPLNKRQRQLEAARLIKQVERNLFQWHQALVVSYVENLQQTEHRFEAEPRR